MKPQRRPIEGRLSTSPSQPGKSPQRPPDAGVDRSLVAMMLELSVEERLQWLCSTLRAIEELRHGLRA